MKYKPRPLTQDEWESLLCDFKLVNSAANKKKQTEEESKQDYSWSHYIVGNLIESIKQGTKYEN